jgi:surface antigen
MYDHIGWYPGWSGDARLWATRAREARWVVRPEPMARAIVVMPPSYVGNSLGHVAFVEWVDYSSAFATGARITISEMNAPTWNKRTQRTLDHHASFQYLLLP